jgi:uncharacterized protein (DUF1778 family)
MPYRGYKKPDSKGSTLRFRASDLEVEQLRAAALKAGCSLSAWLREVALEEAERLLKSKKT